MPHELTVSDKHGNVLHSRKIQTRDDAFTAYDRAVQRANPDAAEVTLVEGGHTNRRHTFPEKADHAGTDEAEATQGVDRERAGDAPVETGDTAAAGEAGTDDQADGPVDPKPDTANRSARSGRASNRPVTAATD